MNGDCVMLKFICFNLFGFRGALVLEVFRVAKVFDK